MQTGLEIEQIRRIQEALEQGEISAATAIFALHLLRTASETNDMAIDHNNSGAR